jgi:hypothetical protein
MLDHAFESAAQHRGVDGVWLVVALVGTSADKTPLDQ